uniref:Aminotransferase-like plant mobile domain-containing protein n=1 Tax=Cajanus cajan TaxID=3821 RepID=A0A151S4F0_CAJCA|nr:hypothetical protein KK1_028568 [Cajanus cajan]
MEEASLKIFHSQVILPFSLQEDTTHAFLGPFMGQHKKKSGNTLLPEDSSTLPFIHSPQIDLNLFGDTTKIFRAFPQPKRFRVCGFVCPTLLDIVAITGLTPVGVGLQGDKFFPDAFDEEISIKETSISWDKKTYLAFINAHMGKSDTPVSTSKHIAFLMYWLSTCVFCTPSLQVPKYYYILAQALHSKKKICLSKLLLASLYTCLDEASESLYRETGPHNLSGPLWLLQLWLNAILEKILSLTSSFTPVCELEGARLTTLTPRKRSVENFAKYVQTFLSFNDFTGELAPFICSNLTGPSWLRENNQVGNISPDSVDMWFGFLSWDVIFSGMR